MKLLFFGTLYLFACFFVKAQENAPKDSILLRVVDDFGKAISGAKVELGTEVLGFSKQDGIIKIDRRKTASQFLVITKEGYNIEGLKLDSSRSKILIIQLTALEGGLQIKDIIITAKKKNDIKAKTGFNVEVINATESQMDPMDVNQKIKETTGVHLRENGGLGGGFELSINGLANNQIRYFMDGIPMDDFQNQGIIQSPMTLNNLPLNLIERIEIYKGVAPVELTTDALGGVINLISSRTNKSYLNASYQTGSFNTHISSFNGQLYNKFTGFFLNGKAFVNYSDNDYKMKNLSIYDELGNNIGTANVKRFNDAYSSQMVSVKVGLVKKKWADELSLNLLHARNNNQLQHNPYDIRSVYGGVKTSNQTYLTSLNYQKKINRFKIGFRYSFGQNNYVLVDTISARYNWKGESFSKSKGAGELRQVKSYFKIVDDIQTGSVTSSYQLAPFHKIVMKNSYKSVKRKGEDLLQKARINPLVPFTVPSYLNKNITGIGYTFDQKKIAINTQIFGKYYLYGGRVNTLNPDLITMQGNKLSFDKLGYGIAVSKKFFNKKLNLKASYEKAYRLPESYELLGDGLFIKSNPLLEPEESDNYNLGVIVSSKKNNFMWNIESNYFLRNAENFIQFDLAKSNSQYINLTNIVSTGIELGAKLMYQKKIGLEIQATYQDVLDKNKLDQVIENPNYNKRLGNRPYLFGNTSLSIVPIDSPAFGRLKWMWKTNYVAPYYLSFSNLGDEENKPEIPEQIVHDIYLNYRSVDKVYHVSFGLKNIFNTLTYDNYEIQKPGRSFQLKLTYSK